MRNLSVAQATGTDGSQANVPARLAPGSRRLQICLERLDGDLPRYTKLVSRLVFRVMMVARRRGADAMKLPDPEGDARATGTWGFLTNHAHVLLCIARDRQSR